MAEYDFSSFSGESKKDTDKQYDFSSFSDQGSTVGSVVDQVLEENSDVVQDIVDRIPEPTVAEGYEAIEAPEEERDPSLMENITESLVAPLGGLGSAIVEGAETLDWATGYTSKLDAMQNITGDVLTYNPENLEPDVLRAYEDANGFHVYDGEGRKVKYFTGQALQDLKAANIMRLATLSEQLDTVIATNEDLREAGYQDSLSGQITGSMSQFIAGFVGAGVLTKPAKLGKYADDLLKGSISGTVVFDAHQERASVMLKELGIENDFINWLADNEDDTMFEGKLKNAIEESVLGLAAGEIIRVTAMTFRGLKAVKLNQDAKAAEKSVEEVNEALAKAEEAAASVVDKTADPSTLRLVDPETGQPIKVASNADDSLAAPKTADDIDIPEERVIGDGRGTFESTTWGQLNAQGIKMIHDFISAEDLYTFDPMTLSKFMDEFFDLSKVPVDQTKQYTAAALQMEKYLYEQTMRFVKSPAYQEGDAAAIAKAKVLAKSTAQAKRTRQRLGNIQGTSLNLHGMANDVIPNIDDITLSEDQLLKVIQDASDQGLISRTVGKPRDVVQAINEIWINSLLSSPVTHAINLSSNAFVSTIDIAEEFGGALMSVPKKGVDSKAHFSLAKRKAYGSFKYAWLSLKAAGATLKKGHNILDEEGMITEAVDDQIRKVAIGQGNADLGELMGRLLSGEVNVTSQGLVDAAGNVIRTPSRFLQAGDELFKQLNFRRSAYAHAAEEVDKLFKHNKDLDPKDFDDMVEDRISKAYENQVNTPRGEALTNPIALKAQGDARVLTFTNELGKTGKKIQSFTSEIPILRQVVPFIRTPINIVKYPFHRSPLGLFSKQMQKRLESPDPQVRSKAQFQMTYGSVIWGTIAAGVMTSKVELPYIDRDGKQQFIEVHKYQGSWQGYTAQQRNALRASGAQPNSIVVEHDDGTFSFEKYNRLDPVAMIAGMAADVRDVHKAGHDTEEMASAAVIAIANQLKDRTYTKGVANFINAVDDPNRFLDRWIQGQVSSLVVPSLVSWTNDDPIVREVNSTLDAVKNRIPSLSDTLPPKYDIFGQPMLRADGYIMKSTDWESDEIKAEFLRLAPRIGELPEVKNGIDLLDPTYQMVDKETGKTITAYERYNQLIGEGKLLRKIERAIRKPKYKKKKGKAIYLKNVGEVDNYNEEQIQAEFREAREEAFKALLKENRTLDDAYDDLEDTIRDIEKGRYVEPPNPVSDFLNGIFN